MSGYRLFVAKSLKPASFAQQAGTTAGRQVGVLEGRQAVASQTGRQAGGSRRCSSSEKEGEEEREEGEERGQG